jgi:hypothetical protein
LSANTLVAKGDLDMNRVSQARDVVRHAAFVFMITMIIGCTRRQPSPTAKHDSALQGASETVQAPLRAIVDIDESRSMFSARVPRVSSSALAPLFERLENTGGELAVGLIRDRSDAPLLRLFVPAPPQPLVDRVMPRNVFGAAIAKKREEAERSRYALQRQVWHADAEARVNAFAGALAQHLEREPDAARTDIRSALVRANLFLAEPTTFDHPAKNIVLLITDGIDNVNADPPPMFSAPAEILLVNGNGTVAYLAPLHPVRFESLDAALRFAVAEGSRRVR